MESSATLVSLSPIQLDFSKNSMVNTTLIVHGQPLYLISSPGKSINRTDIIEIPTQRLLSTIKHREFLPNTVTFADHNGGKPIKLDRWLKACQLNGSPATILEIAGGQYYWTTHVTHRLALYAEHDTQTPVAYMINTRSTLSLVMEGGTENFRDQILVSFLILEQEMRMKEKAAGIANFRINPVPSNRNLRKIIHIKFTMNMSWFRTSASLMDSTTTLVNPSAVQLDFDRDSMKNATLYVLGQPLYMVMTPNKSSTRTEIKEAHTQYLLATIQRRDVLSDTVTFTDLNDGKTIKLRNWLKTTKLMDGTPATLFEVGEDQYYWKTHIVHRLALYSEHDLQTPLAYMIITGPAPSIVMEAGTESIRDKILVSFLIIEQNMRMVEKRSMDEYRK